MMYIELLPPITMQGMDGEPIKRDGEPWEVSMEEFIQGRFLDAALAASAEKLFAVVDMKAALTEAVKEGRKYLALETKHWEFLRDVIKTPSAQSGYNPMVAFNMVPYMRAVLDATSTKPDDYDPPAPKELEPPEEAPALPPAN